MKQSMNRLILCIGTILLFACNQNGPSVLLPAYDLSRRTIAAGSVYVKANNEMIATANKNLTEDFDLAVGVRLVDKESPFDNILYKRLEFNGKGSGQIWLTTQDDPLAITYELSGDILDINIEDLDRVVKFELNDGGKRIDNCSYIVFNFDTSAFFDFDFMLYENCEGLNPIEFLNMQISELPDTVGATSVVTSNK
jgi:hypothetical protein